MKRLGLNALWDRLGRFIEIELLHTNASPEEEDAFRRYSGQNTLHFTYVGALVSCAAALFWWPFDYVIYANRPDIIEGFRFWRVTTLSIALLAIALYHRTRVIHERPVAVMTGLAWLLIACVGYGLSRMGGPEQPWFHALYFLPNAAWIFFLPLKQRVFHTLSFPIVTLTAFFVPHPEYLRSPGLANALGLILFGCAVGIVTGHVMYSFSRRNFFQQRTLQERAEQLAELDRLKSDFFANVSHEIRTPLTLIQAALRTLRATNEEAARAQLTETGLRNSARLLNLINQLLDLARFDSGRATVQKRVVDVAQLVTSVESNFQSNLDRPALITEGTRTSVLAELDPRQLRTVLYNLLSNAMKFTDPATRDVRLRLTSTDSEVVLEVRDNGIGIPKTELTKIFDRFSRVEQGPKRSYEGTGIGLALVLEIVRQHQGTIAVESQPGAGATFTVTLPRGRTDSVDVSSERDEADDQQALTMTELSRGAASAPAASRVVMGGPRILLVEDNADLRAYLAELLGRRYLVLTASNGQEGLERAKAERPDLILSDFMMPGLSGRELVEAVRQDPAIRRTPVIILTAMASPTARVDTLSRGADDYLTKPFEEDELFARVQNQLRLREQERELATVNERLEERVRQQTQELRALATHVETLREDERRNIARELHDELSQTLASMRIELIIGRKNASESPEDRIARYDQLSELLEETHKSVHRLLATLRPRILDDYGFVPAAEWLVSETRKRTRLTITLDVDQPDVSLSSATATALFRFLQESLTNIIKHAGATTVAVRLRTTNDAVTVSVQDNGVGLPPPERRRPGAMGLLGMRERMQSLQGTFEAVSPPEGGTLLTVRVPIATVVMEAA